MNIYLPDDLAAEVSEKLDGARISVICQDALRAEITRKEALGTPGPGDLKHIEIYEGDTDQEIAFLGRHIATSYISDEDAYLTRGGQIVIYVAGMQRLWLFSEYSDLDPDAWPADLMEQIAEALGEKCIKEVDI